MIFSKGILKDKKHKSSAGKRYKKSKTKPQHAYGNSKDGKLMNMMNHSIKNSKESKMMKMMSHADTSTGAWDFLNLMPKMQPLEDATLFKAGPLKSSVGVSPTATKLAAFYEQFGQLPMNINGETINVNLPYHINSDSDENPRKTIAETNRANNRDVSDLLSELRSGDHITVNALNGKASPDELTLILKEAIERGLIEEPISDEGASYMEEYSKNMRGFLDKYGLSVDCSGYVAQVLNYLMDGNVQVEEDDFFNLDNTPSGALKGGQANFTAIEPEGILAGDTMHLSGHIRIIERVEYAPNNNTIYFQTQESTAAEFGNIPGADGLIRRWWKYENGQLFYTWTNANQQVAPQSDENWEPDTKTNTFGRFDELS